MYVISYRGMTYGTVILTYSTLHSHSYFKHHSRAAVPLENWLNLLSNYLIGQSFNVFDLGVFLLVVERPLIIL